MIAALIARNVTIGLRTFAFGAVLFVHGALLAAFLVLWDSGVPVLPGANLYEQQRLVQTIVLLLILPWAAARCEPGERGDDLVLLSVMTAARPSRIVIGQAAALFILLGVVVLSGLPLMLIARQIAALPLRGAIVDLLPALGIAAVAAASSLAWSLGQIDRLAGWLGATASAILATTAVAVSLPRQAVAPCLFVIGIAGVAACAARADLSFVHLTERR